MVAVEPEDSGGPDGAAELLAELDLAGRIESPQNTRAGAVMFASAGSHSAPIVSAER
ncbi:hypothetical protein [Streptomyces sp. NPDC052107]|uniref:hypothetical protein n=1 Tax=Streptomyces sp. NPDC052107 TaxID=3155632 RepID=UPI00341DF214